MVYNIHNTKFVGQNVCNILLNLNLLDTDEISHFLSHLSQH